MNSAVIVGNRIKCHYFLRNQPLGTDFFLLFCCSNRLLEVFTILNAKELIIQKNQDFSICMATTPNLFSTALGSAFNSFFLFIAFVNFLNIAEGTSDQILKSQLFWFIKLYQSKFYLFSLLYFLSVAFSKS